MSDTAITIAFREIERSALAIHPDTARYRCRFDIAGSTGATHRISFDTAPGAGYWKCSCRGNIRWGKCHHLGAMGLPGRKVGKSIKWVQHFRLA